MLRLLYAVVAIAAAHRRTEWRADEVVVIEDTLHGPEGVLATHTDEGWTEPDGTTCEGFDLLPMR